MGLSFKSGSGSPCLFARGAGPSPGRFVRAAGTYPCLCTASGGGIGTTRFGLGGRGEGRGETRRTSSRRPHRRVRTGDALAGFRSQRRAGLGWLARRAWRRSSFLGRRLLVAGAAGRTALAGLGPCDDRGRHADGRGFTSRRPVRVRGSRCGVGAGPRDGIRRSQPDFRRPDRIDPRNGDNSRNSFLGGRTPPWCPCGGG